MEHSNPKHLYLHQNNVLHTTSSNDDNSFNNERIHSNSVEDRQIKLNFSKGHTPSFRERLTKNDERLPEISYACKLLIFLIIYQM